VPQQRQPRDLTVHAIRRANTFRCRILVGAAERTVGRRNRDRWLFIFETTRLVVTDDHQEIGLQA